MCPASNVPGVFDAITSPATCRLTNSSYGRSRLNESTTQSRYRHASLASIAPPIPRASNESVYRTTSSQCRAHRSP
jgi:hypothetical protein